jgi:hypothetical protein
VRRELERIEIPDEHRARERAWPVVHAAFAERQPVPQTSHWRRVAVVAVALGAVVAAAVSPPGQAVVDEIREVVGIEHAQPALFSLPAEGRLLVASDAGIWILQDDGSKRLLGDYSEAAWSPFGRFVVAARENELAALEPDGDVRWIMARRAVRFPRWAGSAADTRIAYLSSGDLHVVAGDGTDDVDLGGLHAAGRIAHAWRPGGGNVLAYVDWRGRVHAFDADTGRTFWAGRPFLSARFADARKVMWSSDGRRLLLVRPSMLVVFGTESASPLAVRQMPGVVDAEFEPGSHRLAIARRNEIVLLDADRLGGKPRRLFTGAGPFERIAWSPDGRWLLVSWPAADQWVFVRADGSSIRAAANVTEQFRSRLFPRVEGWCCTS